MTTTRNSISVHFAEQSLDDSQERENARERNRVLLVTEQQQKLICRFVICPSSERTSYTMCIICLIFVYSIVRSWTAQIMMHSHNFAIVPCSRLRRTESFLSVCNAHSACACVCRLAADLHYSHLILNQMLILIHYLSVSRSLRLSVHSSVSSLCRHLFWCVIA